MYIGNVVAEKIQFETHHVNLFFALSFFPKCAGNMGIFPWHVSGIKRVNPLFTEKCEKNNFLIICFLGEISLVN